jgi:hypothetical protein
MRPSSTRNLERSEQYLQIPVLAPGEGERRLADVLEQQLFRISSDLRRYRISATPACAR